MSLSKLEKIVGIAEAGQSSGHFFEHPGYDEPILARLDANFQFSQWRLFDYDPNDHMSQVCQSADEWVSELRNQLPGFADVGLVVSRSSSQRVLVDGKPIRHGRSLHGFVLTEPEQTPADWGTRL